MNTGQFNAENTQPLKPAIPDLQHGVLGRVAKNSVVVLAAKSIEIFSSLIIMMMLARMLQPARYGDYALIQAIILSFQPLINLEINTILIREMAAQRSRERILLGGGMLLKAMLVIAFVVSAIILERFVEFDPIMRVAFYLAVLAEVFQQIMWVYSAVFMARERMEFEPLLSLVFKVTALSGIGIVALVVPENLMGTNGFVLVFAIMAFSQFLRALIGMIIVSGFLKHYRIQWSLSVAKELISQSWIMGIATFCTGLSLRIDIYFLRYFRSSEEIALFHIPHMFTLQIQILAISVVTALFPVFSRWSYSNHDAERFKTAQEMSIRLMSISGLGIAATAALFPNLIIRVLGGQAYDAAVPAMVILALCIPILFLNYLMANLLTAIKKQHLLIYGAVISLLLNSLLDYLWVPVYGIVGASVATVISYGVQLAIVMYLLQISGKHGTHAFTSIILPGLLCLAGVGISLWLSWSLVADTLAQAIFRAVLIIVLVTAMVLVQPPSFIKTLKSLRRPVRKVPSSDKR